MIDITPTLFDHYKMKAFSEFRKMLEKDHGVKEVMARLPRVQDIPVHPTGHRTQNKRENAFAQKLTSSLAMEI
jgi:hypothetical protein